MEPAAKMEMMVSTITISMRVKAADRRRRWGLWGVIGGYVGLTQIRWVGCMTGSQNRLNDEFSKYPMTKK
jgi:hypothetical protein